VGDKANTARYIASASTDLLTAAGTNTKDNVTNNVFYVFTSTDVNNNNAQLVAVLTTVGANVSLLAANAGQVEIYLDLVDLSEQSTVTGT
jgi:hypothetical protein